MARALRAYLARQVRSGRVRVVTFGAEARPPGRAAEEIVDVTPPGPPGA